MTALDTTSSRDRWTLVLEASSANGSVALFRGDAIVSARAVPMGASRDDALFPAVLDVFAHMGLSPSALSSIVCGAGPGSFTSLRIAAALAKGLAHATGSALFAVPSLLLAAAAHDVSGRYLVHANALRGERYALGVAIDLHGRVRAEGEVTRVASDDLVAAAHGRSLLCVPSGASSELGAPVVPDAAHLLRIVGWDIAGPVSVPQWEPAYGRLAEAQVKWEVTHDRPLLAADG